MANFPPLLPAFCSYCRIESCVSPSTACLFMRDVNTMFFQVEWKNMSSLCTPTMWFCSWLVRFPSMLVVFSTLDWLAKKMQFLGFPSFYCFTLGIFKHFTTANFLLLRSLFCWRCLFSSDFSIFRHLTTQELLQLRLRWMLFSYHMVLSQSRYQMFQPVPKNIIFLSI